MEIHGVKLGDRPLISYHDHNGDKARPRLMRALEEGKSVAYASEAGTPLIADPGFDLSRAAAEAGYYVTAAPGASAVITALTISGLPTDRFLFAGFLPNASAARRRGLQGLADVPATLVFYESPKRLAAMLRDAAENLGATRMAAVSRELTKKFEECRRGTLEELAAHYAENNVKGEVVVLIGRADSPSVSDSDLTSELEGALKTMSVKDAAEVVAKAHGMPKRKLYQMALEMERNS
ncbi:Ribosomal RNA small subunit methyltransferase I [Nymphon striatum]|nr:Ribosomal RNA small subunit methyltransferase I [Nymphon striatum]